MRFLLGIDDTDSRFGLCTTFTAFRVVQLLIREGCTIPAYPRLVRLNPNIPFKTRGNAAVAIEFEGTEEADPLFERICSLAERLSDVPNGANTGVVFVRVEEKKKEEEDQAFFGALYERALCELVNASGVRRSLEEKRIRTFTLGNGMGLVGASASLGFDPSQDDHTYELLAYRTSERCGRPRVVDPASVRAMDGSAFPLTFNNYDYGEERVLITPHGPDPVFLGIRGDDPAVLLGALRAVRYQEELAGHMVYVTNQGTDAHLRRPLSLPPKAYSSGFVAGEVKVMEVLEGGHLYLTLGPRGGDEVRCAIYEPAGDLRRAGKMLAKGDLVRVGGGVRRGTSRHPALVNIERLEVLALSQPKAANPTCQECRVRMKSEGLGKGFQCRKCGARIRAAEKTGEKRTLQLGVYLPSTHSLRHLAKPLARYFVKTNLRVDAPIAGWLGIAVGTETAAPEGSPDSAK